MHISNKQISKKIYRTKNEIYFDMSWKYAERNGLDFFYSLFFFYSIDINMSPSAVLRKGSKYLRLECYC